MIHHKNIQHLLAVKRSWDCFHTLICFNNKSFWVNIWLNGALKKLIEKYVSFNDTTKKANTYFNVFKVLFVFIFSFS